MKQYWKRKKVLVTGGGGFVGSHVVDALVAQSADVTVLVSHKHNGEKSTNLNNVRHEIAIQPCNLLDREETVQNTRGFDCIFHFAAMDGGFLYKQHYPADIFNANTMMTLNVLHASVVNSIDRVFLMSSIDVYGKSKHKTLSERYGFDTLPFSQIEGYAWSKRFSEVAANLFYDQYKLKIAIARAGNIYGPRDYLNSEKGRVIPTFIQKALRNEDIPLYGNGKQERSFLFVTDFAKAALHLLASYTTCEPVNLVSSHRMSIRELAETIKELTQSQSSIQTNTDSSVTTSRRITMTKARRVINFREFVSLHDGLVQTIADVRTRLRQ